MNSSSATLNNSALTVSAVSWGAIIAGATAAAAISLILLFLGTSWGFFAISPWANDGISAKTFGFSTIIWVTLTSLIASALGGYIAGRLRTKWVAVHTDEVYFRDTAHGFLAWAVATLFTATLMTATISGIVKGGVQTAAAVGDAVATVSDKATSSSGGEETASEISAYFINSLFRPGTTSAQNTSQNATPMATEDGTSITDSPVKNPQPTTQSQNIQPLSKQDIEVIKSEAMVVFRNALWNGSLEKDDVVYLGQLVAQQTGMPAAEAEQRVNDIFNKLQAKLEEAEKAAKEVADEARKASAYASLWLFIALLIGAFIASFTAIFGGRQRDL